MMTSRDAAAMIDISAVQTANSLKDIEEVVDYAKTYHFINVHVLPCWVKNLADMLQGVDGVYVGAPAGFPSGAHCTETKVLECEQLIRDGVEEMDVVMNIGKLKNREYGYVLEELKQIVGFVHGRVIVKVIIEINVLNEYEMLKACDLVMECNADFVKTGTGWIPGDANLDRIHAIKQHCKDHIKIKAAGGIRTKEEFLVLADMGVQRMGINTASALEIVRSFDIGKSYLQI